LPIDTPVYYIGPSPTDTPVYTEPSPTTEGPLCLSGELQELTTKAQLILIGKVGHMGSAWDEDHNLIFTYITIKPEQWIKGETSVNPIIVRVLGGTVDGITLYVNDMLSNRDFRGGQRLVLFLVERSGVYEILCGYWGEFLIAGWDEEYLNNFVQRIQTILEGGEQGGQP
jgi:hypothetical protein